MAALTRGVAMLMMTLSWSAGIAADQTPGMAPPSDPSRPVTIQTTTTQNWVPGRWTRVDQQEIWQPGHWETVQTSTTLPGSSQTVAATTSSPSSATTTWIAERWQQSPDGWVRYAGRWSDQPDVIVERRANEAPRTVYVDRPVETVVVERPVVTTTSYVGLGWYPSYGWGAYPGWNVSVGFGSPYWYGGCGNYGYHHYRPYCPPPVVSPVIGFSGSYVRHR